MEEIQVQLITLGCLIAFKVKNTALSKIQLYASKNFNESYGDGLGVVQMPTGWNLSRTKW